jgi:hypothetical protein
MKYIKTFESFLIEAEAEILFKDDLINLQRKGAREEDAWDNIKDLDKSTQFKLVKDYPLSDIIWNEKGVDILQKQKNRLDRLKAKDDGSAYYKRTVKYEETELEHIENLIKKVKAKVKLNPIVISKTDRLLDGYHRAGVYQLLGIKKVDVYKEI